MKSLLYSLAISAMSFLLGGHACAQTITLTNDDVDYCADNEIQFNISQLQQGVTVTCSINLADVTILNVTALQQPTASLTNVQSTPNGGTTFNVTSLVNDGSIELTATLAVNCNIFQITNGGGYTGGEPITRAVTLTATGATSVVANVDVHFPMPALNGAINCNMVWDNTSNTYVREIHIINNGSALDVSTAIIRISEVFTGGNTTITSIRNTSGVILNVPTTLSGVIDLSGSNLSAAIASGLSNNLWAHGGEIVIREQIAGCPNFESRLQVAYNCPAMGQNNFCFQSISMPCQFNATQLAQVTAGNITLGSFCYGTNNTYTIQMNLTNTGNLPASITSFTFRGVPSFNPPSLTNFDYTNLSVNGFPAVFTLLSTPDEVVTLTQPFVLAPGATTVVGWDATTACPNFEAACSDVHFIGRDVTVFWEGDCNAENNLVTAHLYNAQAMGGSSIGNITGPGQLLHTNHSGTDIYETPRTYTLNLPNNINANLWPGNGANRTYLLRIRICDALRFTGNAGNTAPANIANDITLTPANMSSFNLSNLPANWSFTVAPDMQHVDILIPFGQIPVNVGATFLRGLGISMQVVPHCGEGDNDCGIEVLAGYMPDRTCTPAPCVVPIGCTQTHVSVQCPGCVISGVYGNFLNVERYAGDYGLYDANNDGVADIPIQNAGIVSDNNIARKTMLYGDRLLVEYHAEVHIGNGYLPGITLTNNQTATTFGDMLIGDAYVADQPYFETHLNEAGFSHAYIKVDMTNIDALPAGKQLADILDATDGDGGEPHLVLNIIDGVNTYTTIVAMQNINTMMYRNSNATTTTGGKDEFLYDISVDKLDNLPAHFVYHDGVQIEAHLIYRVAQNVGVDGPVNGYEGTIEINSFGALRPVTISAPGTWPADRRVINCPNAGSNFETAAFLSTSNPCADLASNMCSHTASSPSGVVTVNSCYDVQWGCQGASDRVRIGGFDFNFADYDPPVMRTCGLFFEANSHGNHTEGDELSIGHDSHTAAGVNFFNREYRNWMQKYDLDVLSTPTQCNTAGEILTSAPFFFTTTLDRTTQGSVATTYNLTANASANQNCQTTGNVPFVFTYGPPTSNNTGPGLPLQCPDDMQIWNEQMFFVSTPCNLACNNMEFCIRQENNFNPTVDVSGILTSTTPDIADGLELNHLLIAPTPPSEDGVSGPVTGHRMQQETFFAGPTVQPQLVWSLPINSATGTNGMVEYVLQIENSSTEGDAPNPWIALHLPTGGVFWGTPQIEILDPFVSQTSPSGLVNCNPGAVTVNGLGGYDNYAVQDNFTAIPAHTTLPGTGNNTDYLFRLAPNTLPQNPYYVLRRTVKNGNNTNTCLWEKSNLCVRLRIPYDCSVASSSTALNNLISAATPTIYAGYACDEDMNPANNGMLDGFNSITPTGNATIAHTFATSSCGFITNTLPFNLQGTTVSYGPAPSQQDLHCGETATFTWHNNGPGDAVDFALSTTQALPTGSTCVFEVTGPNFNSPQYLVPLNSNTHTFALNSLSSTLVPSGYTVTATVSIPACFTTSLSQVDFIQSWAPYCYPTPGNAAHITPYNIVPPETGIIANLNGCGLTGYLIAKGCDLGTYQWEIDNVAVSGGTGQELNYSFNTPGVHTVAWSSGACSYSGTLVVGGATVSVGATGNVGCGGTNGTLTLNVTAGSSYNVSWSGPSSGSVSGQTGSSYTISGLTAGSYTITVTDANGCTATVSATVTTLPALGVAVNYSCTETQPSLEAVVTGGAEPYTYMWSTGGTNPLLNLPNGALNTSYTVTVNDANNCNATATYTFAANSISLGTGWQSLTGWGDLSNTYLAQGKTIYIQGTITFNTVSMLNGTLQMPLNLQNCVLLMGPGARIVVDNTGTAGLPAQLTIQASTIRAQCDRLWGEIRVKNGVLRMNQYNHVEDAQFAVHQVVADYGNNGRFEITQTNTFNRNFIAVFIDNVKDCNSLFRQNTIQCTGNILPSYTNQVNTDAGNSALHLMPAVTAAQASAVNTNDVTNTSGVAVDDCMDCTRWGWAGILAFNSALQFPIANNSIRSIANGIILNGSSAEISNNVSFNNIPLYQASNVPGFNNALQAYKHFRQGANGESRMFNGNAIYATGIEWTAPSATVLVSIINNGFNNCHKGIKTMGSIEITANQNTMNNMVDGIVAYTNREKSITIRQNTIQILGNNSGNTVLQDIVYVPVAGCVTIDNQMFSAYLEPVRVGIGMYDCSQSVRPLPGTDEHLIEENTITINPNGTQLFYEGAANGCQQNPEQDELLDAERGVGIAVWDAGLEQKYPPKKISGNTITLVRALKGIYIQNVEGEDWGVQSSFRLLNNTINLNSTCNVTNSCATGNVRNEDGIFISNSRNIYVRENTITGNGSTTSNNASLYPHGITLQSNSGGGNQIYCNTVSSTYTGYRVEGQNPNVDFMGNNIGNPSGVGNRLGLHVLDLATMTPIGGALTHYDKGNRWYGNYATNQAARNENGAWNGSIWVPNVAAVAQSKFEVAPSAPWSPTTPFPAITAWIEQTGSSSNWPCSGLPTAYKTDEVRPYEPIGDFERGVMSRRWQYARFAEVTQYELDKQVFARIREAEKLRPLSGTETAFLEKNKTGSIGRFAELNQELATLDEAAQFVDSVQWAERIEQLRQMNAAIEVNTANEQLQKQLNDIYISSRATKTGKPYTREQQSVLVDVAQRCFQEFGAAVFQSRGMLGAYDTRSYDAYDHCVAQPELPELPAVTNQETYYHLMPNPAREQVTISKVGGLFELEQISINGLSGDELLRYEKLGSGNQFTVSTKALPAGTYLCHITQGENHIATLKLVIVP